MAGLGTALACARGGHEVMVLERDATPMPTSAADAFAWERRGAPQVRHSHAFLARLRTVLRDRAPDVLDALFAAGASEIPMTANLPATLTDRTPWPDDDELVAIACRRTTFEWVLRRLALAQTGVRFLDGVGVENVDATAGDPPRVTGVGGHRADLVVDARGPRSSSDAWLGAIGARPVPEQLHESGIVYFSRFYAVRHGADAPVAVGPAAADIGYLKFAVFVGDNDTFSITYAVDFHDDELRRALTRTELFEAAARALTPTAPWRAPGVSDPITDVHVMAGLRNRYRPFVVDGAPVVHGLLPVGDASVCTNPLYGRGCSLAFVHAFGLADAIEACGDDLDALARAHDELTRRELVPWFRSALFQDEQSRMLATGEHFPPEDPRSFLQGVFRDGLLPALRTSPLVFRAFLRWFNLLATPDALMSDPAIIAEVVKAYNTTDRPEPEPIGPPDRETFLSRIQ
jgi:2-polyprenyl-6-methoxyphenol hydroxylase-like FAD-dependent oxidoreductase